MRIHSTNNNSNLFELFVAIRALLHLCVCVCLFPLHSNCSSLYRPRPIHMDRLILVVRKWQMLNSLLMGAGYANNAESSVSMKHGSYESHVDSMLSYLFAVIVPYHTVYHVVAIFTACGHSVIFMSRSEKHLHFYQSAIAVVNIAHSSYLLLNICQRGGETVVTQ